MANGNNLTGAADMDVLFEGLDLSSKETVAGCAMVVYLNSIGKAQAVGLMDRVVDVRVFALNPEERSGVPMDSHIYCDELRKLLTTSINYSSAIMDGGWLHSEEQEAENLRSSIMGWMGNLSAEDVVTDMGADFAEFLVRLSRWVRE